MGKGHRFSYNWTLKDANFTKDKGKVFSCFACGGGSMMGYKLAGFDVIGCNEIDPKMNECYERNNNPKYNYVCDIRDMVKSNELPEELYNLDILDGSPLCSTFSISGSREDSWGVEKKFREGQKKPGFYNFKFFDERSVAPTLTPAEHMTLILKTKPMYLSRNEIIKISSFPLDYKGNDKEIGYLCGMSVPPVMMANVANNIYEQWLSKL